MIIEFKGMRPDIEKAAYIAENATISGDVALGEGSSVWFNAVMRAEVASITVGALSNVQDHVMLHADYDCPVVIGDRVSIGHGAIVHLVAGVPGVVKKTFEPGQRPQENNDEVYTADALAYAEAPHYPVPAK